MGYMRHHTIVVSSCNETLITKAHTKLTDLIIASPDEEMWVSPISPPLMNSYRSFFFAPDGSKEGWNTSDVGDKIRSAFISWLKKQCYPDGSTMLDWVEVQFADEDGDERILQSNSLHRKQQRKKKEAN